MINYLILNEQATISSETSFQALATRFCTLFLLYAFSNFANKIVFRYNASGIASKCGTKIFERSFLKNSMYRDSTNDVKIKI